MTVAAYGPTPNPKKSFRDVWLITIGHALTHWYPATFYLMLPLIGNELGLSYAQIGSILTIKALLGAISNVPGGLFVDTVGRKGLLMAVSLFWIGAPYLVMGFTHEYWLLLTCAALVGIGNNLWHPTAIPLLAQRFPERRGLAVSIHGMGGNVGDAVAPLVAGALLAYLSWRDVVIINVLPGIVMACVLLLMLGRLVDTPGAAPAKRPLGEVLRDFRLLLRNRTLIFLGTSSIFRSMTQSSLMTFLPIFLANQMGYSPVWIGACMAGLQVAGFTAAPIAGHLSDTMGRRQIIVSSMTSSAVLLLFMAIAGNSPWFVLFVSFLGFFLFATRAIMQAWLLDSTPANMGGSSIGVLFAIQSLGSACGPLISGLLADSYGLMAVFYFLAATIVVANLFIFFTPAGVQHRFAAAADERAAE
ncbi:MAG: transporter, family, fosmidomycin resistance protein [Alphaproteobacteria bacterium]|nr:transporter, family, fosmidomycin resistance protein [Alphaproteobacteria bacterium]